MFVLLRIAIVDEIVEFIKKKLALNAASHRVSLNKKQPLLINKVLKSHATLLGIAGELQYLFG